MPGCARSVRVADEATRRKALCFLRARRLQNARAMLRTAFVAAVVVVTTGACAGKHLDSSGSGGSAGSAGSGGSGGGSCGEPDVVCPNALPFPGAPCATTDTCTYPVGDGVNQWTYTCQSGHWDGNATCQGPLGGGCPIPPLAESCDEPFAGTAGGAVELGAADPTQPFTPIAQGDELPLVWGGQGSPMVAFRLRATSVGASCIRADTTLSIGDKSGAPSARAVVLHCGETLRVFEIFPVELLTCAEPMQSLVDLTLRVDVKGVGSVTRTVKVQNPGCALPG